MRSRSVLLAGATLLLSALPAEAQSSDRRWYYALIIGPGVPISEYASRSAGSPGTGPAEWGYIDTFANLAWRGERQWGVAVSLAYGEFAMSSGDDDWWQVVLLTAGPMYVRPLTRKLWLELKAKAGVMVTTEVVDSYRNSVGNGVALDLRSGLRYDVFRRWSALGEVGIASSRQTFNIGGRDLGVSALISGIGAAYRW